MADEQEILKNWIEESDNIVFFGGAGVSTESGIPDFRGEKGIFKAVNDYGVRPETILSHSFFEVNKEVFFDARVCSLEFPDKIPHTRMRRPALLFQSRLHLYRQLQMQSGDLQTAHSKQKTQ